MADQIQEVIERQPLGVGVDVCRELEGHEHRLVQSRGRPTVAVILVSSHGEFLRLLSIRDSLRETQLILILPDRLVYTISMGHKLRPRFLTYVDSDPAEVGAVLAKMLENLAQKQAV
jgi:hypothetical protein